jgi:hypothetical protein
VDKLGNVIMGGGGGSGSGGGAAASYLSPGNFTAAWASATTLTLTELPFPPLQEQIVQVSEYDGDTLVDTYSQNDPAYNFTWAPAADSSTGTLTIAGAVMTTGNEFVVQIMGPQPDTLDVTTDFAGPYTHQSPRDFDVAWASATTLTIGGVTPMAMDPDQADIRAVVEIAAGGQIRMTYTRMEWAMTWAAGAAGEGTLTIAGATMQNGSSFIMFVEGPEHGIQRADAGGGVAQTVKRTQNQDTAGKVQPSGADADVPIFVKLLGLMAVANGPGIYKSPHHFTAAYQAATAVDLSGHPAITDVSQFLLVVQISSAGVVTWHYPSLSTGAFSWDAVNDRLTVTGATFANTDVFGVVLQAKDRYADDAGNHGLVAEVDPYELRGDGAGVPLITVAQTFTAGWVDLGPEISMFGYNALKLLLTFDINDSTDLQVRVLEKHESGGAEEFNTTIELVGTADVKFQPGYWEKTVDADSLDSLVYYPHGSTPYVQVQIKAGVLGGGTAADMDAAAYVRGTFGG